MPLTRVLRFSPQAAEFRRPCCRAAIGGHGVSALPSTDRFFALVPCAGVGARAGVAQPKQYQRLAGQPLVWHTSTRAMRGTAASACKVCHTSG